MEVSAPLDHDHPVETRHSPARAIVTSPGRLYVATIALVAVATVVVAIGNPRPEGACSGIGWGCSLYGWEHALVGLMVVGVPFLLVSGLALLLTGLLPEPVRGVVSVVVAWSAVAVPTYVIIATLTSGGF